MAANHLSSVGTLVEEGVVMVAKMKEVDVHKSAAPAMTMIPQTADFSGAKPDRR